MQVLNWIGSAMPIAIIAFLIADLKQARNINKKALIGRVIAIIILFIALLRT